MHTEKREDPLIEMGYEIRDLNVRGVRLAVYIFFGFVLVSGAAGYVIFILMNPRATAGQPQARFEQRLPGEPAPLLQTNMTAKTDIMTLRRKEDESLFGAPTQNQDGSYRIPIAAAMKMIADDGGKLPSQAIDASAKSNSAPTGPTTGGTR